MPAFEMITDTLITGAGAVSTAQQVAADAAVTGIADTAKLGRHKFAVDAGKVARCSRVVEGTLAKLRGPIAHTIARARWGSSA